MTPPPAKHSALPWRVDGRYVLACDARETVVCEVTGALTDPTMHADIALIVRAVNAHEGLVGALEAMMQGARHDGECDFSGPTIVDEDTGDESTPCVKCSATYDARMKAARLALAAAKEVK